MIMGKMFTYSHLAWLGVKMKEIDARLAQEVYEAELAAVEKAQADGRFDTWDDPRGDCTSSTGWYKDETPDDGLTDG